MGLNSFWVIATAVIALSIVHFIFKLSKKIIGILLLVVALVILGIIQF